MRVALATATATGRSAARPKGAVEGGCVRGAGAGVGGERCWMHELSGSSAGVVRRGSAQLLASTMPGLPPS